MSPEITARIDAICETVEQAARLLEMAAIELNELRRDTMRDRQTPIALKDAA